MPHEFIKHLKEDHKKQKEISTAMVKAEDAKEREKLRQEFYEELYPHVMGEEASIFPFLKKADDQEAHEHALVSLEEHAVAKYALKEFMACDPASDVFKAKAEVLDELNTHHYEEEEKIDFARLTKLCDKACLDELFEKYEKAEEKAKKK